MAPSPSISLCTLSNFDVGIIEVQLLIIDTGAASIAAQQKMHNAEVAKLRHLLSNILSATLSSELTHQHTDLQLSLTAVSPSDSKFL